MVDQLANTQGSLGWQKSELSGLECLCLGTTQATAYLGASWSSPTHSTMAQLLWSYGLEWSLSFLLSQKPPSSTERDRMGKRSLGWQGLCFLQHCGWVSLELSYLQVWWLVALSLNFSIMPLPSHTMAIFWGSGNFAGLQDQKRLTFFWSTGSIIFLIFFFFFFLLKYNIHILNFTDLLCRTIKMLMHTWTCVISSWFPTQNSLLPATSQSVSSLPTNVTILLTSSIVGLLLPQERCWESGAGLCFFLWHSPRKLESILGRSASDCAGL